MRRFSWGRLRTLHIDNNELRDVDDDIGRLTALELLNMNNNQVIAAPAPPAFFAYYFPVLCMHDPSAQIRRICPGFCHLTSLITLSIEANAVITLPPAFGNLHSLQVLKIGANVIEEFPPSFSALQVQTALKQDHFLLSINCSLMPYRNCAFCRRSATD